MRDPSTRLRHVLLAVILVFATLLRFEALFVKWGPIEGGPRAVAFQTGLASTVAQVRPDALGWRAEPYLSGDPFEDLRFAREMYSFYGPSVREPVFVFGVKLFQWLVGYQDVVVCLASGMFSALAVWATYLVGSAAFSPWIGLGAALGLAIERDVISQGVIGFKDDAFTLFFLLLIYAVLRSWDGRNFRWALLSGLFAGAACLTRITSLTFVLPMLIFVGSATPWAHWRERWRSVAFSASMMAVVLAPFLMACWIAFDDPLFSISDRTRWYRESLSLPATEPMNPLLFLWSQVSEQPAHYLDTALGGLLTYPLTYKWAGFDPWLPGLGTSIEVLAIVGLFAFVWSPRGRFILLALFASLVPYIFTWRVPNFGLVHHFRYTLHAYPIQLIAATLLLVTAVQLLWSLTSRSRPSPIRFDRPAIVKGLATMCLIGMVWLVLSSLPYLRLREELGAGRSALVFAGAWDRIFFRSGWYPALTRGNVTARFSKGRKTSVWVPMVSGQAHRLVLRLDPFVFVDAPTQLLGVDVNGQRLAVFPLEWKRRRVGEYVVDVPAALVDSGWNQIEFEASYSTRAASVPRISTTQGPDSFHELVDGNFDVSFMLWAIVVEPMTDADARVARKHLERWASVRLP